MKIHPAHPVIVFFLLCSLMSLQPSISSAATFSGSVTPEGGGFLDFPALVELFVDPFDQAPAYVDTIDSEGHFSIDAAGTFYVKISTPPESIFSSEWDDGGEGSSIQDNAISIVFDASPVTRDYTLEIGGSISGTLYSDSNPILSEAGNMGVNVYIGDPCGSLTLFSAAGVDDFGHYTVRNLDLDQGPYFAQFVPWETSYMFEWYFDDNGNHTSSPDCSDATPISLSESETSKSDVSFDLELGATIIGSVNNSSGTQGILDICIAASREQCGESMAWTTTIEHGFFELTVPAGAGYYLLADDYCDGEMNYVGQNWAGMNSPGVLNCEDAVRTETTSTGSPTTGINFRLEEAKNISGNLHDEDGHEITGHEDQIFLEVLTGDPCGELHFITSASVMSDGSYSIPGVPESGGPYFIQAGAWGTQYLSEWYALEDGLAISSVDCRDAEPVVFGTDYQELTGVDFQLALGTIIEGSVEVSGVFTQHIPVFASVWDGNRDMWIDWFGETDEHGTFRMTVAAGKQYRIETGANWDGNSFVVDEWWDGYDNDGTPDSDKAVLLPMAIAGETISGIFFKLDTGGLILGTAYELDGITPIQDEEYVRADMFRGDPCEAVYVTGADLNLNDGTFRSPGLIPGEYLLKINHPEFHQDFWWNDSGGALDCAEAQQITVLKDEASAGKEFLLPKILSDDFNGDGVIDLRDPIVGLQVLTGKLVDLNPFLFGDHSQLGLGDTIGVLQYLKRGPLPSLQILSHQPEVLEPLQSMTIFVNDLTDVDQENSTVMFDDLAVAIADINMDEQSLTVTVPIISGLVAVNLHDSIGNASNTISLDIQPSSLPSDETVETVISKYYNHIEEVRTEIEQGTSNSEYTQEQQDAFSAATVELGILQDFAQYFIEEEMTDAERHELAALLEQYVFPDTTPESNIQSMAVTNMVVTTDWDAIRQRRDAMSLNGWLQALTDFSIDGSFGGVGDTVAEATPVINVVMAVSGLVQKISSIAELFPTLLASFNISVTYHDDYPQNLFYRDADPAVGTCKGTFVSATSIAQASVEQLVGKIAEKVLALPQAKRTRMDEWLTERASTLGEDESIVNGLLKNAVNDTLNVSEYASSLSGLLSAGLSDPMIAPDIEFPCSEFDHVVVPKKLAPLDRATPLAKEIISLDWAGTIHIWPQKPGSVETTVIFSDKLAGSAATSNSSFETTVLNHKPELISVSPSQCQVDSGGNCNVTLSVWDDDFDDKPVLVSAELGADHGAVDSTTVPNEGVEPNFSVSYDYIGKPVAEPVSVYVNPGEEKGFTLSARKSPATDEISLKICDPWECAETEVHVPVDFSGYIKDDETSPFYYLLSGAQPRFGKITPSLSSLSNWTEAFRLYTPNQGVGNKVEHLSYVILYEGSEEDMSDPAPLTITIGNDHQYSGALSISGTMEYDALWATPIYRCNNPVTGTEIVSLSTGVEDQAKTITINSAGQRSVENIDGCSGHSPTTYTSSAFGTYSGAGFSLVQDHPELTEGHIIRETWSGQFTEPNTDGVYTKITGKYTFYQFYPPTNGVNNYNGSFTLTLNQ